MEAVEPPPESKRPKDTPFRQQRLKACQPILTPIIVISTFLAVGVIFFTLGFIIWHYNGQVVEVQVRYDNIPTCPDPGTEIPPNPNNPCLVTFNVPTAIPAPAYFYYKLTNFYQNHRRYVSSLSEDQLRGSPPSSSGSLSSCDPLITVNGTNTILLAFNPCGLIADSWFIDSYSGLRDSVGTFFNWTRTGISWSSDREKFQLIPPNTLLTQPFLVGITPPSLNRPGLVNYVAPGPQFPTTNEDFIVWNRVAGLPTFRKLYAILPGGLPAGTYTLQVNNIYSRTRFGGGTKSFVISSTSFIGGKNDFLGYAYIAIGALSLLLALVFFIVNLVKPRKLGDPELLSWNQPK